MPLCVCNSEVFINVPVCVYNSEVFINVPVCVYNSKVNGNTFMGNNSAIFIFASLVSGGEFLKLRIYYACRKFFGKVSSYWETKPQNLFLLVKIAERHAGVQRHLKHMYLTYFCITYASVYKYLRYMYFMWKYKKTVLQKCELCI